MGASQERHMNKTTAANRCGDDLWGVCCTTVGLLSLAVYLYTVYPGIPGGDSGELITAAHELGVSHPPGYPLFTVLAWLSIQVTPYGTVAWRVGVLNAFISALAALLLSVTIYRYTDSVGSAVLGAVVWSFSRLSWTWAVTAEVFALNNLFTAGLLYLMVEFDNSDKASKVKLANVGAFVCSLSLCNQHTMVVYTAVIAIWVLLELRHSKLLTIRVIVHIGLCFIAGLTPYLYLPLSAYLSPGRWTWGDQRTPAGFMKHLLRQEYGTFDLATDQHGGGMLTGLRLYGQHVTSEYTMVGLVLGVAGAGIALYRCLVGRRRCLVVAVVMVMLYLLLFCWRANLDLDNPLYLGVVERFWLQADCVVVLLASVAASHAFTFMTTVISAKVLVYLELFIATAVGGIQIHRNWETCNHHDNTVVTEFSSHILDNMPKNAIVLTRGDLPSNTFRYQYLCENKRPDIQVFDQEVLTYSWSVAMMRDSYPGIHFPGDHMGLHTGQLASGARVFNLHSFLEANYGRGPIVACIGMTDREPSWQADYLLFPFGPCSLVLLRDQPVDLDRWLHSALNIFAGWNYPYDGFAATSWERVATNEMWQAKISVAFYLYRLAQQGVGDGQRQIYTLRSYQLYTSAIEAHRPEQIPGYWHKNYALVCERMLQLEHDVPESRLVRQAVHHFQTYVDGSPDDQDIEAIQQVIQHLQQFEEQAKS